MCGITAIVNLGKISSYDLVRSNNQVRHRGPDDEGYLLWENGTSEIFAGTDTTLSSRSYHQIESVPNTTNWKVGLGHRRLSILDLSPLGYQPMVHNETGLAISYNGEIFNYIEIRDELLKLGHVFKGQSDTEVILKAWLEWGKQSLSRFNGMFSIIILDPRAGGKLYAIRDRFGVKPLYWTKNINGIFFASEIKQLREIPGYTHDLNELIAYDYLAFGQVDHTANTFDKNIFQIPGGHFAEISLTDYSMYIKAWYALEYHKWNGNDAVSRFRTLLEDSVSLRLRSDVPVGSCLSGGLDSSAIVSLMGETLKNTSHKGIKTVTACFNEAGYDEWDFAQSVIQKVNAEAYKIYPSFDDLITVINKLIWHMDEPFTSSSQYSQWCVFKGASQAGLKVMLDGQGADEQLAGYNSNELPLYTGLIHEVKIRRLIGELKAFKKQHGFFPKSQVLKALMKNIPLAKYIAGKKYTANKYSSYDWLDTEFKHPESCLKDPRSLRETLYQQLYYTSLPALLRYEDRNSMAWSIEARVPFMDYRLVEFNLSLPEYLLYHNGVRKYILREAMKGIFPDKIYHRKDKMGFITPEELWFKGIGKDWFRSSIDNTIASLPDMINKDKLYQSINAVEKGAKSFNFSYWRIACLGGYLDMIKSKTS